MWHCPSTNQEIALGYQWFYRNLHAPDGATATQLLGLPISAEYGAANGTVRQEFERGSIIYDKCAAVGWQFYYAPVGQELQAARAQVAQTSAAPAATKQQAALDEQAIAAQKTQIADLTAKLAAASSAAQSAPAQAPAPAPAQTETPATSPSSTPMTADELAALSRAAAQVFGEVFASALAARGQPLPAASRRPGPSRSWRDRVVWRLAAW